MNNDDVKNLIRQPIIADALHTLNSINSGGRVRTSLQPVMLHNLLTIALDCPEKPLDFVLDVGPLKGKQFFDKICLTSGGADSTIAWYYHDKPQGVYIDIGQGYATKETSILNELKIPYLDIALTSQLNTQLDKDPDWKHIIPGRNFLFLTVAAEMVKHGGTVIFSVVDGEGYNSGKGDKSEAFIDAWIKWYRQLTGKMIYVETCDFYTKAGWLRWFASRHDINIIRNKTVTCFSDLSGQCGLCQACLRKYLSFTSIGMDIKEDFIVHPLIGGKEFVKKYKIVLNRALQLNDYNHYSMKRCTEDLAAIQTAEMRMKK